MATLYFNYCTLCELHSTTAGISRDTCHNKCYRSTKCNTWYVLGLIRCIKHITSFKGLFKKYAKTQTCSLGLFDWKREKKI